jgi:prefoldin subunit 5
MGLGVKLNRRLKSQVTVRPSRSKQRAMKTSIEHIRAKITELEARITDLRITERELEALDTAPARGGN